MKKCSVAVETKECYCSGTPWLSTHYYSTSSALLIPQMHIIFQRSTMTHFILGAAQQVEYIFFLCKYLTVLGVCYSDIMRPLCCATVTKRKRTSRKCFCESVFEQGSCLPPLTSSRCKHRSRTGPYLPLK